MTNTLNELIRSKVDLANKRAVGKNPPPKLPFNRPKAVPSIPSATVAPPEDKTMTMTTTFRPDVPNEANAMTSAQSGFNLVPRKSDYMVTIEK